MSHGDLRGRTYKSRTPVTDVLSLWILGSSSSQLARKEGDNMQLALEKGEEGS